MAAPRTSRWTVSAAEANVRVDVWLAKRPEVGSRARAREWIERGKIFLNGAELTFDRAGERVRAGDEVGLWEDRPGSGRPRSRDVVARREALRIVFEDETLLVADKPPGLLVEPLPGTRWREGTGPSRGDEKTPDDEVTLLDLVSDHLRRRPALVVHRIDRDTTGLVVFAKDARAQIALKRQFERRTAERVYLAVLSGRLMQRDGTWTDSLVWDKTRRVQRPARPDAGQGREAVASYRVLEQFEEAALVEVRLVTGKRNQIRVQAGLRGHPLVGERIYRARTSPATDFPRQALHAARLAFRHPTTGARVEFTAPVPADLNALIRRLRSSGGSRTRGGA